MKTLTSKGFLGLIIAVTLAISLIGFTGCGSDGANSGSNTTNESNGSNTTEAVKNGDNSSFGFNNLNDSFYIDPNVVPTRNVDGPTYYCYINEDPNAPIHQFIIECAGGGHIVLSMDDVENPGMIPDYGKDTFNSSHWRSTAKEVEDGIITMPNGFLTAPLKVNEDNGFFGYQNKASYETREPVDSSINTGDTKYYNPIMRYRWGTYYKNNKPDSPATIDLSWRLNGNLNDLYTITFDTLEYVYGWESSNPVIVTLGDTPQTFKYIGAKIHKPTNQTPEAIAYESKSSESSGSQTTDKYGRTQEELEEETKMLSQRPYKEPGL